MPTDPLPILAGILVLGIAAQAIAWRLRMPSILLLLGSGILAGSLGFLKPDELIGRRLLSPVVTLSVAVILYEGGLTLRFRELARSGGVVVKLVTVGALVTWGTATALAHFVLGLSIDLALLLGAVLIVTGPTVIQPLLRHVRPSGQVGSILKWEGIVIDPIGALTALLVFEGIGGEAHVFASILKTLVIGGGLGALGAGLLIVLLKRYLVPDFLQTAVSLSIALGVFAASNMVQHESGLFTVTLMGVLLANQNWVEIEEILQFKENLGVLLLSALFVVLGALLDPMEIVALGWRGAVFVAGLVLVARPLAVLASSMGEDLERRELAFLSWMAPRGIVAAAVASVFALKLQDSGVEGAGVLVSATFAVILGTVLIYGFTAPLLAYRLGLAEPNPRGILIVGAHAWHRGLAEVLLRENVPVLLVDTNSDHTRRARMAGIPSYTGNAVHEHILEDLDLGGIGKLLAATPNDWINLLAAQRIGRTFGSKNVFQLAAHTPSRVSPAEERVIARVAFDEEENFASLQSRMATGQTFKATRLSEEFDMDDFLELYGEEALPLLVIAADGKTRVFTPEAPPEAKPGETLVAMVKEPD